MHTEPAWSDLQVFVAVAETGSISGAAARLAVNHSTVLRRVAALERALGVRLFDRLPGGYALTAPGNTLAERLAGISGRLDEAQRAVRGLDEDVGGTIRLTTTDTLLHGLLMPLLADFGRRHPAVQLQVAVDNRFTSLTRREADVAVRGSNRPPANLVGRHVGDIRTALYAARGYVAAHGADAAPEAQRWVGLDDALSHLEQAKWLQRHVPADRVALRVDTLVGMLDAVRHGVGVGWLLCPLADAEPSLVQLRPPEPQFDTQVWVLTHPDLRQVARIRAFTRFLVDALAADPRLARGDPAARGRPARMGR